MLNLHTNILFLHRFQDDSTFEKILELIPEVENPFTLAVAYFMIGIRHSRHGSTAEALEYYHKAIELAEKYDAWMLAYSYHYLGGLYESVNQVDNALEAYEKSWNATLKIRYLNMTTMNINKETIIFFSLVFRL